MHDIDKLADGILWRQQQDSGHNISNASFPDTSGDLSDDSDANGGGRSGGGEGGEGGGLGLITNLDDVDDDGGNGMDALLLGPVFGNTNELELTSNAAPASPIPVRRNSRTAAAASPPFTPLPPSLVAESALGTEMAAAAGFAVTSNAGAAAAATRIAGGSVVVGGGGGGGGEEGHSGRVEHSEVEVLKANMVREWKMHVHYLRQCLEAQAKAQQTHAVRAVCREAEADKRRLRKRLRKLQRHAQGREKDLASFVGRLRQFLSSHLTKVNGVLAEERARAEQIQRKQAADIVALKRRLARSAPVGLAAIMDSQ